MINGDFPPSSSETRFRFDSIAAACIFFPTSTDPVKATLSICLCTAIALPQLGPSPGIMLITPGGKPASLIREAQ
jgi:hypothetical protein